MPIGARNKINWKTVTEIATAVIDTCTATPGAAVGGWGAYADIAVAVSSNNSAIWTNASQADTVTPGNHRDVWFWGSLYRTRSSGDDRNDFTILPGFAEIQSRQYPLSAYAAIQFEDLNACPDAIKCTSDQDCCAQSACAKRVVTEVQNKITSLGPGALGGEDADEVHRNMARPKMGRQQVTGTRQTNPAVDLHDLPRIDLKNSTTSDHFDAKVESSLRRDLPIITTPHAKAHLTSKGEGEAFTAVHDLDFFQDMLVGIEGGEGKEKKPAIKVTGMPGKHVPPGVLGTLNDLVNAVPPTNGWMIELGYEGGGDDFKCGYRIYISGDTLLVDELKEIPKRYAGQNIDLMLIHLGGTTIPSPSIPLLMVTMDAEQGLGLVKLIDPDLTIPIHFDDYDVFLSPLEDFKKKMEEAGLQDKVVYLDRKDKYQFKVKQ
ncbi:MAG: hypothetical protein Q9186_004784 [Xanthomendoza sp. 1 TL-2023]